ncbi:MAG: hypothetical protein FWD52_09325 [Candidatus Bathyarchaeota archaeon]|nr:hypothetical protein [Candidatus Termiticorpusculum sp.]
MPAKIEVMEYQVLLAGPNDVKNDIEIIKNTILDFNNNLKNQKIIFQPKYWQYDVPMDAGKPVQEIINGAIVNDSDIVIAVFGKILGNGTLEEITKSIADQKRTWVFFAEKNFKLDEVHEGIKIKEFKDSFNGLFSQYKDETELRGQIQRQLELFLESPPPVGPPGENKKKPLVLVFGAYGESRLKILKSIEELFPNEFKFIRKYTTKKMSESEYAKTNLIYGPDEIIKCTYRYAYMGDNYGIRKDEINDALNSNQIPIILVCGDIVVKLSSDYNNSMLAYIHCFNEGQEDITNQRIKNRKQGLVKLAAKMFGDGKLDVFLTYDPNDDDGLSQNLIDKIREHTLKELG